MTVRTRYGTCKLKLRWGALVGGGMPAGVGVTMALFNANLTFQGTLRQAAKRGILVTCLVSAAGGLALLAWLGRGVSRRPAASGGANDPSKRWAGRLRLRSSTPAFRCSVWNPEQGFRFAEERDPEVDACHDQVGGSEFRRHPVGLSIIRVVEPTAAPAVRTGGPQPPQDGQSAQPALPQRWIGIVLVLIQAALRITWNLQPQDPAAQQTAAVEDLHGRLSVNEPDAVRNSGEGYCARASQDHEHGEQQENATGPAR
jgi:Na+/H+ antiporter 1